VSPESATVVLAALAGGLAAVAVREVVVGTPAIAVWVAGAVEPLRRAGLEGYAPTGPERRRLAVLGTGALLAAGLLVVGPGPAPLLAPAGPALAASVLARRRARYRRAVEHGVPELARAIADALGGGRSVRAALMAAGSSLQGAAAVEMARLRAALELGTPTSGALAGLQARLRSPRAESLVAALLAERLGGGDLAALLRRFAAASAERDRVAAEARSATAQARFTGMLVVAMPAGAALFAEVLEPGFVGRLLGEPAAAGILAVSATLQLAGFAAIRRLGRVTEA
jgi:tight adherence protein B